VLQLRNAFLDVFVSLLRGYRSSITVSNSEAKFEHSEFLQSFNSPERKEFLAKFVSSQMFQHFVDLRLHQKMPDLFDRRVLDRVNSRGHVVDEALKKEFVGDTMTMRINPVAMDFNFELRAGSTALEYWFEPQDRHRIEFIQGESRVRAGGVKNKRWFALEITTPGVKHLFHFASEDLRDELLTVLRSRLRSTQNYAIFAQDAKLRWPESEKKNSFHELFAVLREAPKKKNL